MSDSPAEGEPQVKLGNFLYASELAGMLGLSKWSVGDLGRRGVIETRRLRPGSRILYSLSDAKAMLAGSPTSQSNRTQAAG